MAEPEKIRITLKDLEGVEIAAAPPATALPSADSPAASARDWGRVSAPAHAEIPVETGAPSLFLQAWFYLALAGVGSAFLAWVICEPSIEEGGRSEFPGTALFQIMTVFLSVALGTVESVVERSPRKAARRALISIVAGSVLGTAFYFLACLVFGMSNQILREFGALTSASPAFWCGRALAWAAFGISGGLVYGLVDQSGRKCLYGVLGGALGAGLGGFVFDPIALLLHTGGPSRAVGVSIFGLASGLAIGLVEGALKDRWLYVSAGPLAGKQFILYKPVTRIGSQQGNDLYLFKDPSILPAHAAIQLHGPQVILHAAGVVLVGGQAITAPRTLRSGETIQIGRYTFQYQEKEKRA